jgi:hypothetical protein
MYHRLVRRTVGLLLLLCAGCPERALEIPEDILPVHDLGRDFSHDFSFDMAMQKFNPCPAGADFIFTIDEDTTLSRFNPMTTQFFDVGNVNCPSTLGGTPNSMAVQRDGKTAWVNYSSGELFHLDTTNANCTSTPYTPGQGGFVSWGMSFAEDTPGSLSETLYISATNTTMPSLGTVDLVNFKLASSIPLIGGTEPELTGDDNANLWGFFPGDMPPKIARIDKQLGTLDMIQPYELLSGNPTAWGVASYRGDFYIFLQRDTDASTVIYRVDGMSNAITILVSNTGRRIVGVGVATCAGNGLDE